MKTKWAVTKPATLSPAGVINAQIDCGDGHTLDVWGWPEEGATIETVEVKTRMVCGIANAFLCPEPPPSRLQNPLKV
jgi:hypothetical protein